MNAVTEQEQILLVDDDAVNLQMLRETLKGLGHRLLIAKSGQDALTTAKKRRPTLILLDVMMPDMDGLETCRRLKADPDTQECVVIFLSALGEAEHRVKGLELGAVDYIAKPFLAEEVITRVQTHLRIRALERDLERRNRQLVAVNERILQAIGEGIYGLDADGRVTFINQTATAITGWFEAELFGQPLPEGALDSPDLVRRAIEGKRILFGRDTTFSRRGGERFPVEYSCAPVFEAAEPVGVVLVFRDVTEQKAAHEALIKANDELREAQARLIHAAKMESIGQLAAGVAHEVKNPLGILQLSVDFLDATLDEKHPGRAVMADMADAVTRADRVVKGLLDFSREQNLALSPGHIADVLEKSMHLVRHELDKRNIRMDMQIEDNLPELALDTNVLQQVFINLLTNAAQAMESDGQLLISAACRLPAAGEQVPESVAEQEELVAVLVDDTGPGIPQEKLDKVFDPFFTTKPSGQGTGLGLSITHSIIERHHGTIKITNRAEGGARVTVLFPIPKSDTEDD